MDSLKPHEKTYWENFLQTLSEDKRPKNAIVSAGYAGTPAITDSLLELYLSGKKIAGSSMVEDFLSAGDPLPAVGNFWIYLDSRGQPSCILRTEKIVTHKFKDVPLEIVIAEGEGDLTLDYWKKVHSELYSPFLKSW
ncbi:MAG: ASCH domain-containing protein [Bacteriovorax sp.]